MPRLFLSLLIMVLALASGGAFAQDAKEADSSELEPSQRIIIRFVTTDDYPPFNAADEDGTLTGFNVDLARAICLDQEITCDIKPLSWDALIPALMRDSADAVIAAHRVTAKLAKQVGFTRRYFYTPARFAVRRNSPAFAMTPSGLDSRTVAVVKGSAHEAYLLAFFRNVGVKAYPSRALARQALQTGATDAIFDDGIGLVFWANGTISKACCVLRGGPFFEPRYFGDGIAMLVRPSDNQMRNMLNRSIEKLQANGRFQELVDRYFPIRVY